MIPLLRSILLAIAATLTVAIAHAADPLPAAGSVKSEFGNASHGWVVVQSQSVSPWMLCHITPRKPLASGDGSSASGSLPGMARFAMNLESIPLGLAAMGSDLVLAFDYDTPGAAGERRMFRLRAERDSGSGLWRTIPLGRMEMLGVLPPGELLAFFGTARGPAAVLRTAGGAKLVVFIDTWREMTLPEALVQGVIDGKLRAWTGGNGMLTLLLESDRMELWSAPFAPRGVGPTPVPGELPVSAYEDGPGAPLAVNWTMAEYALLPPGEKDPTLWMERFANSVCLVRTEASGASVWLAGPDAQWLHLKDIAGVPPRSGVFGLAETRRIFAAWVEGVDPESMVRRGVELELDGGQILHDGLLKMVGPVSGTDYRLVIALLIMVSASTLAFILNPDDGRPFSLPDGYSLATGGVRVLAAVLDFTISFAICRIALRFASWEVADGLSTELVAGTLLANFALGVFCEAASGKTPGKMLLGLEVIEVVKGARAELSAARPSLGRVLLRNVVKWIALPVSALGVFSPEGRGRPDQLAGTVVTTQIADEIDGDDID